jgi:hypothetical protein
VQLATHRPVNFSSKAPKLANKTTTNKASVVSAPKPSLAAPKPVAPKTQSKPAPAGGDDDWETF